jgi:hypothetical protein
MLGVFILAFLQNLQSGLHMKIMILILRSRSTLMTSTKTMRIELLVEMIKPGLLPSSVFGKDQSATYEFYNPSVSTRQLGFGQLPIGLYFSNFIKLREVIPNGTHYQCLLDLILDSSTINLFNIWWAEWCDHLFYVSPKLYCEKLDPAYKALTDEVLSCLIISCILNML